LRALVDRLGELVGEHDAAAFLRSYPPEYIEAQLRLTGERNPRSKGAFLRRALEEDYAKVPPPPAQPSGYLVWCYKAGCGHRFPLSEAVLVKGPPNKRIADPEHPVCPKCGGVLEIYNV